MNHLILYRNHCVELIKTINKAKDGDTIICHNEVMKQIAEIGHKQMCPDKELTFENPN